MCVLALSLSSLGASKKKTVRPAAGKRLPAKLMDGWSAGIRLIWPSIRSGRLHFLRHRPAEIQQLGGVSEGLEEVLKGTRASS